MSGHIPDWSRRQLLERLGVTGAVALAGCSGNTEDTTTTTSGGNSGGGTTTTTSGGSGSSGELNSEFHQAARDLDFSSNWQERRMNIDGWSNPNDMPNTYGDKYPGLSTARSEWRNSGALQSGTWKPPEGFDSSIAAEVSSISHINYGSLKWDPATIATQEMLRRETGISVESIELGNGPAVTKAQAALSSQQSDPTLIIQNNWSLSTFIANGYAEAIDPLMPKDEMWGPLQPYGQDVFTSNLNPRHSQPHLYAGPQILEGSVAHIRPDLLEEQGLDPSNYTDGEWTWDDLEKAMEAFAGTDVSAWAFYGGVGDPEFLAWNFQEMLYQQGQTLVQDNGKVRFDTESGRRALRKWVEWVDKGWVPEGTPAFQQGDLADQFLNGNVAMVPVFSDLMGSALSKYEQGTEYTINIPPAATAGPNPGPAGVASTASLIINPYAPPEKKLAALTYMDARCSYESAWYEYMNEGNQSWVKDVYQNSPSKPMSKKLGEAISVCYAETFQAQQQIYQKFATEANLALTGDKSADEAIKATQNHVDVLLGQ